MISVFDEKDMSSTATTTRGAAGREEKNKSILERIKLRIYQYEVTTGELDVFWMVLGWMESL